MSFEEKIKNHIYPTRAEIEDLHQQNLNRSEICDILNISSSTYKKLRKYYNIAPKKHKVNLETYIQRKEKTEATLTQRYGEKGSPERQKFYQNNREKQKLTCLAKYGVEDTSILPEVREKYKKTCMEKYGVDNPMKSPLVQKKVSETDLQKYGSEFHIASKEIRKKSSQTIKERFGVENSCQCREVIEKRQKTNMERYGVQCCLSNPEIRRKGYETMKNNGTEAVLTSSQQKHINDLFNGELNYLFGYYHIDSYLPQYHIGIEYSGRGHDLSVRIKKETLLHFQGKERARKNYCKNHGLPIVEFFSKTDKLPPDEKIKEYVYQALQKFSEGATYYSVDLDNETILYEFE